MSKPNIEVKRSGNKVTISRTIPLMASQLKAMKLQDLKDGETLTLDFTLVLDVDELAAIIGKDEGPTKPGWAKRIAEAVVTEGLKTAVKEVAVKVVKETC